MDRNVYRSAGKNRLKSDNKDTNSFFCLNECKTLYENLPLFWAALIETNTLRYPQTSRKDVILKEISTVFFCKRSTRLHEMISGYSQVCQTLLKQSFAYRTLFAYSKHNVHKISTSVSAHANP